MKISENLYVGPGIKNPENILNKLNKRRLLKKMYVVAFFEDNEHLEILETRLFLQKSLSRMEFEITALVNDYDTAVRYVRALVEISIKQFGSFNQRKVVSFAKPYLIQDYMDYQEDEE